LFSNPSRAPVQRKRQRKYRIVSLLSSGIALHKEIFLSMIFVPDMELPALKT